MNRQGFTIVELLVSMLLIGIVLAVLNSLFSGTLKATNDIQVRNDSITDIQIAEQIVTGKIREAWYVFPATGTITFTADATVTNPMDDTTVWNLSTHPILAMILPPDTVGTCSASLTTACYTFYAYYPVKRSGIVGSILTVDALQSDSVNDSSAWTLMEYRKPYLTTAAPSLLLSSVPSTAKGRVLADYIQPTNVSNIYTMFSLLPATGSVKSMTMSLRTKRTVGSKAIYLPSQTSLLTISATPRNLNK